MKYLQKYKVLGKSNTFQYLKYQFIWQRAVS